MRIRSLGTMFMAGALAVMTPQWAQAAGTAVCTSITNTARVNYDVGGITQTPIDGVAAAFNVASKVNLTVTTTDLTFVTVSPGATAGVLTFTVKNDGNAVQDYALTGVAKANGAWTVFGNSETDNFNGAAFNVYVESGANAGYQAAEDTATFIDELAPTDAAKNVYVVITGAPAVALARANGDIAVYSLLANTHDGGVAGGAIGAETTNSSTAGACAAPVVLADLVDGTDDEASANPTGDHSARSAFKVLSAMISINKVPTTIWDPINYNSSPKAIPGAIVQYVVTVANAGGAASSATLTTIGDTLIGSLAIDPNLLTNFTTPATPTAESANGSGFKAAVTGSTRVGAAGSALANNVAEFYTTTSSADGVDIAGQVITATLSTLLPVDAGGGSPYTAGELKPGETFTLTFNVIIQ